MKPKSLKRLQRTPQNIGSILILLVLLMSCEPSSDNSQSALIQKINAVQEQVMAQGNLSAEEEQAISSLCSIFSQDDGLALHPEADQPDGSRGCIRDIAPEIALLPTERLVSSGAHRIPGRVQHRRWRYGSNGLSGTHHPDSSRH